MITVTDLFAGAGGSSTGMMALPGVQVVHASNHWNLAISVHNANHPETDHSCVDLHREDPAYFPRTDVLWASPECTKWSQANGTKRPAIEEGLFEDPLSDEATHRSRLLMFDVLRFIEHHRYRAVIVENVVDIATQKKYTLAWYEWRRQLLNLGYRFRVVSLNSMHAGMLGTPAPQSRDRIYIVCWREGERDPDVERALRPRAYCPTCDRMVEARQSWKNGRTVGRYRQSYVYTHAECGTVVEPDWLPAAAAIDWTIPGERIGDRLSPKTRARIAAGIARYWGPVHLEAAGNTFDAANPQHRQYGDPGGYYRVWPTSDPLRTMHTTASKALAVPVEGRDGKEAQPLGRPMRTQTTRAETALAHPPFVAELSDGGSDARPVTDPAATFTAGGNHHALVTGRPFVTQFRDRVRDFDPFEDPMRTIVADGANHALVHRHNTGGAEMTTPVIEELRTLTSKGHQSLLQQPRPRVSAADLKAAEALVPEVMFRMFRPHEVAAGMAFPGDYNWHPDPERKVSNRDLVKMAGNAVTPPAARDLVGVILEDLFGA